jgi:mannose-6-phosphate isomerase-like protein (cupin superfamily)
MDEAKLVVDNETYQIRDLNLYDTRGKIMFTVSVTVLKTGKQTKGHSHIDTSEVYEFTEGSGLMLIDATAMTVTAGDYIFVERGRFHKVINISQASDLVFRCYFTGEIRRPHLKL